MNRKSSATADIDWIEITGNTPSAATCTSTARSAVESPLAMEQNQHLAGIHPNPAKNKTTITLTLGDNEQAVIMVYDAQGHMVDTLSVPRSVTSGTQQVPYNLDNKKPGVYNVVVVGNKGASLPANY